MTHRGTLAKPCMAGLLCLLLAACGEPTFRPLAQGETLLAFGDSLTEGRGVSPSQSYPSVLANLSGHPVVNGGVSGELSQAGRARLPGLLARHRPALVILLEGGNDILRGSGEAALKANLAAMIEAVQGSGAQILLVGVPRKSLFADGAPPLRGAGRAVRAGAGQRQHR
ncbi:GDSL-type esterase/lipase family protein [Aeromonas caviae]|uniref:GDSL-type esterase/lipase family protein n=1 Tax=Aeromonas caviae TaxID=648 RepID=UPI002B49075F|nr:GDSL-type esterase/lipase family protein [Aeromonas caviae]